MKSAKFTQKQFIKDLATLVSFRTLTPDRAENARALEYIRSRIAPGAIFQTVRAGGAECLIASNSKMKTPDVCFLVHADVVAGKPEQFALAVRGGFAYGRGASDMKFSIPIGCALLNELLERESRLSFALVVTTDEETGGFGGSAHLAGRYGLKPKLLIVPDGGDNLVFVNRAKGVCMLEVSSRGTPAHSSRIWEGKNALEPLILLCQKILRRYGANNRAESMRTTVNIGVMQGGVSANQVCPEARCTLDFRFSERNGLPRILSEVKRLARSIDSSLRVSILSSGNPTFTDVRDPSVRLFLSCFEKETGKKIPILPTYGASDARHFARTGAPVLMLKPKGGDIHGDNERISIRSCMAFYRAALDFLAKLEALKKK